MGSGSSGRPDLAVVLGTVQQNAGNSEELASSADELSSQVVCFNELVDQLKMSSSMAALRG